MACQCDESILCLPCFGIRVASITPPIVWLVPCGSSKETVETTVWIWMGRMCWYDAVQFFLRSLCSLDMHTQRWHLFLQSANKCWVSVQNNRSSNNNNNNNNNKAKTRTKTTTTTATTTGRITTVATFEHDFYRLTLLAFRTVLPML